MKLAPTPVPLPPVSGIGSPKVWDGRELVRVEDADGSGWVLKGICLTDGHQKRIPVTLDETSADFVRRERAGVEFQPVGTDFDHAVKLARRDAFTSNALDSKPYQSSAVLQGVDGSYYVTSLGDWYHRVDGRLGTTGSSIDSFTKSFGTANVTALHPDVVAVVDRSSWVDLRADAPKRIHDAGEVEW